MESSKNSNRNACELAGRDDKFVTATQRSQQSPPEDEVIKAAHTEEKEVEEDEADDDPLNRARASSARYHRSVTAARAGTDNFLLMHDLYGNPQREAAPALSSTAGVGELTNSEGSSKDSSGRRQQKQCLVRPDSIFDSRPTLVAGGRRLRRMRSVADVHEILESIQEDLDAYNGVDDSIAGVDNNNRMGTSRRNVFHDVGLGPFREEAQTQTDQFISGALQVEGLFETHSGTDSDDGEVRGDASQTSNEAAESSSLAVPFGTYEDTPLMARKFSERKARPSGRKAHQISKKFYRLLRACRRAIVPLILALWRGIATAYFAFAALPLFLIAWVLYYYLNNPSLAFLPGSARVSWLLNFFGRQLLTLELARVVQWIMIDILTLRTKVTIQLGGPLLTLLAIQSKGWPFLIGAWACIDLCIIRGTNEFSQHWLFWMNIAIYSTANSGGYILSSELYWRCLLSLLFISVSTTCKRTYIAVRFGRRVFVEFKPKLEKLLQEICLLAEVAELVLEEEEQEDPLSTPHCVDRKSFLLTRSELMVPDVDLEKNREEASLGCTSDCSQTEGSVLQDLQKTKSGRLKIQSYLDRWEEPVNKLHKNEASIKDFLRFRRALELMDESQAFGEAFGDAATRKECITSALNLYRKLLPLNQDVLPFDTLATVVQSGHNHFDRKTKLAGLRKLFTPDRFDKVPLVDFVQGCDSLYRRLRYFRASVDNASAIDLDLEGIIDGLFYSLLFLVIMTALNFNPWPLLLSLSTLLVSFSFAMGTSVSRWVEGLVLIAVQRPFGLGDRITITNIDKVERPGPGDVWLVEDINLYSTTLRFASTNELCTVRNGCLCNHRIVNLTRSPGAVISFDLLMHRSVLDDDNLEVFVQALRNYVDDNPRDWDCVLLHRIAHLNWGAEQATLRLEVRHRHGWVAAPRILQDRGNLEAFLLQVGDKMKINNIPKPDLHLNYSGGSLQSGYVERYVKDVMTPSNMTTFLKLP